MSLVAASLSRRRAQEKNVKDRQDFLKDESNATYVAKWEERTYVRIEHQDQRQRANQLAEVGKISLRRRQSNICELLSSEEQEWREKLEKSQNVSTTERMNHIHQKTKALKEKREKQRDDFVALMYEKQWRDGCDELRSLHSKAITDNVMRDRTIVGNLKASHLEKTDGKTDNSFIVEESGNNDNFNASKINEEMKIALDCQVALIKQCKHRYEEEIRLEEQQKLKEWQEMERLEKEKERKLRQDARVRGEQILEDSAKRIHDREKNKLNDRKHDSVLLKFALYKESKQIKKEKEQQCQGKEAAREYLSFLSDQMVRDQQDNVHIDVTRNQEMEKSFSKREKEMNDKSMKQRNILKEVNASRMQQIREKEILQKKEKADLKKQVELSQIEWDQQGQKEREEVIRKKEATIQNTLANKLAMEEKLKLKRKKKDNELLVQRQIQMDEKNHMSRVKQEVDNFFH
jgi:hypothetical protein